MKSDALLPRLLRLALVVTAFTVHRGESQVLHCQPGDVGCQRCSASCSTISPSFLPECCEAFNTCCDHYFSACKQCSQISLTDKFFPEYCCASFTACCDQVTTIKVSPTTKKPVSPASPNVLIGENAIQSSSLSQNVNEIPSSLTAGSRTSSLGVQRLNSRSRGSSRAPSTGLSQQPPLPSKPTELFEKAFLSPAPSSPRIRGRGRGSNRQRTSVATARTPDQNTQSVPKRRRVTSRGRVIEV